MGSVTRVAMLRVVLVALVVLAVLVTSFWVGQRRLIYFPDRYPPRPSGLAQEVTLHTTDGLRLTAWLVAPPGGGRSVAVLVAPGNAGNRRDRLPLASSLADAGLTVLLLDYRGYGGNPGRPSEVGLAHDVPAGLVLRSPFVDLAAVGRAHYPWLPVGLMLRDRYPLARHVARVTVPTVVVYGTADSVVPASQSRRVAELAAGPVRVVTVDGADHNDPALVDGVQTVNAVVELAGPRKARFRVWWAASSVVLTVVAVGGLTAVTASAATSTTITLNGTEG